MSAKHAQILSLIKASLSRPEVQLKFRPKRRFPVIHKPTGAIQYPFDTFRQALNYANVLNTMHLRKQKLSDQAEYQPVFYAEPLP